MKNVTLFSGKRLIVRLALAATMIVFGGEKVWAEDIVVVNGSSIADGWQNGAGNSSTNYTLLDDCLQSNTGKDFSRLRSVSSMTLNNQRIVAQVKRMSENESYFIMFVGWSANEKVKFGYNSSTAGSGNEIYSNEDYIELISEKITISSAAQLDFRAKNLLIKSIKIVDDGALELSENQMTALQKGSKSESVHVKYTPKKGWNTICVPFNLKKTVSPAYDHLATIFGDSYSAYTLSSFSDGCLTFNLSTGAILSNVPLLVHAGDAPTCPNDGFELNSTDFNFTYSEKESGRAKTVDDVTFQGTYAPMTAGSLDGCYGVTKDGQIAKAGSGTQMNGYRAYLTGLPDGSSVKMFVIDGDDATDVGLMQMVEGEDKAVYNISGQRVQKARKGLYIIGGKKVIIK